MVKNKTGGKNAKKFGRKHLIDDNQQIKVRFTKEEGELYGIVQKNYGGNMDVICEDGIERLAFLRKKFRGRHKFGNHISTGTWVMIGLRDWQVDNSSKKEKCDLIEVYNSEEMNVLFQKSQNPNLEKLRKINDTNDLDNDDINFSLEEENNITNESDITNITDEDVEDDDEIDLDDI